MTQPNETSPAAPAPAAGAGTAAAAQPPSDQPAAPSGDGRISIDDFMRVELRVAKVLEAEAVPKSKKLLKLTIDAGTERRTIVAGIAEAYAPDQLVGRTVVIVANLKPAKIMGVTSHGMVLAAKATVNGEEKLILSSVSESVKPGCRVA